MNPTDGPSDRHAMRCMEIWGGSHAAETLVSTPGLDAWVYSMPHEGAEQGGDVHYVSLCGGGIITRLIVADVSGHGGVGGRGGPLAPGADAREHQQQEPDPAGPGAEPAVRRAGPDAAGSPRRSSPPTWLTDGGSRSATPAIPARSGIARRPASWTLLDRRPAMPSGGGQPAAGARRRDALRPVRRRRSSQGDLVIFYTDALIEAGDPAGQLLGEEGLLEIVRGLDPADPSAWARPCSTAWRGIAGAGRPTTT